MVNVDKSKCIGCGACVALCSQVFEMGKDGKSQVKKDDAKIPCAKQAKDACPVSAITL